MTQFTSRLRAKKGNGRGRVRPTLEVLEDRTVPAAVLLSPNAGGTDAAGGVGQNLTEARTVSVDGRFAVFTSTATNLVTGQGDGNAGSDVFLRDLQTGVTTLVSHASSNATQAGNAASTDPGISADGRYVVYLSKATDLLNGFVDGNGAANEDVFHFDRVASSTTLISRSTASATTGCNGDNDVSFWSADGLHVAFLSQATDLISGFLGATSPICS